MKPHLEREANGRWMGDVLCTACAAPAVYKTKRLCKRCFDRVRNLGFAVGPNDPFKTWWSRLGRPEHCVYPNCHKPHKALGLCIAHYWWHRRHDPLLTRFATEEEEWVLSLFRDQRG